MRSQDITVPRFQTAAPSEFWTHLLSPDCLFLHLPTFNPSIHPNHLRGSPWQLRSHNLTDPEGPKNLMDKHVLQTTELRRKRKKCFSAEKGTKMGVRKAFPSTQLYTEDQMSASQPWPPHSLGHVTRLAPVTSTLSSPECVARVPHPLDPSSNLVLQPMVHIPCRITMYLCNDKLAQDK